MATEPRRIALASPLRYGKPRFAVGGQGQAGSGDIKLYEWVRERQEMRMVGLQTDLGQIRAMAWSPHPAYPSIIATGLSTGRTTVHSLSSSTLSPSPNHPNLPLATLNIKHSRPVTSIAFSPLDPNYIATGLERHRSDHSLLVWDVADAIASSSAGIPTNGDPRWNRPGERIDVTNAHPTSRISEPRHLQAYCASELVNSCAFLPASYSLLASTNNRQIRLFDLRSSHTSAPPRDAAAAGAGAVFQYQTRAVYGLTPHPIRAERFASFEIGQGQSPSGVRLWDTRMSGEVLSFEVPEAITGLEWWGESLGVGMKEGGVSMWDMVDGRPRLEEKDWVSLGGMRNIVKPKYQLHSFAFASSERGGDVLFVGKDGTINIAPLTHTAAIATSSHGELALSSSSNAVILTPSSASPAALTSGHTLQHSPSSRPPHRTFPASSSNTLLPYQTSDARQPLTPAAGPSRRRIPHEIPEAEDSDSEVEEVLEGYARWRAVSGEDVSVVMRKRAEEGYGLSDESAVIAARHPGKEDLYHVWETADHLTRYMSAGSSKSPDPKFDLTNQGIWGIWTGQIGQIAPLSSTHPGRASRIPVTSPRGAYLATGETAAREPIRQGSAAWASLKSQTGQNQQTPASSSSTASGSSSAVSGFRARTLSSTARAGRVAGMTNAPPQAPAPSDEYLAAVTGIYQAKVEVGLGGGVTGNHGLPSGERAACRRMILALCEGRRSGYSDEQDISDVFRTRKAAWAYFANEEEQAVRILLDSSDARHRLTGAALATSLIRSGSNRKPNREEWISVIEGIDDPYSRAVLRRVAGEGWEAILREGGKEGLELIDRVIIAVNNLNDKELSEYLYALYTSTLDPSSSASLSSAIAMLGLSNHILPFLQTHLDIHADLQTSSLLAALIPSNHSSHGQRTTVERWTEGYRDMLDTWKMFAARVEYDVKRQELAREYMGRGGMSDVVKGNCPVCNYVLSRQELDHAQRKVALKGTTTWPNERTYTCTFCGNALPRCVICLTHVESKFKAGPGLDEEHLPTGYEAMDTIDTAYVACQTCRHGGHAGHILPWFEGGLDGQIGHSVCPVVGCDCECANL